MSWCLNRHKISIFTGIKLYTYIVIITFLISKSLAADVPRVINYQGKIAYDSGSATGGFYFRYELYQVDIGGISVFIQEPASDADSVWCEDGLFSDTLGLRIDTVLTQYSTLYLQVSIKADWSDSWTILTPREQLLATPWALTIADNAITQDKILWDSDASGDADSISAVDIPFDNTASGLVASDL